MWANFTLLSICEWKQTQSLFLADLWGVALQLNHALQRFANTHVKCDVEKKHSCVDAQDYFSADISEEEMPDYDLQTCL